jgi:hypothetical protein
MRKENQMPRTKELPPALVQLLNILKNILFSLGVSFIFSSVYNKIRKFLLGNPVIDAEYEAKNKCFRIFFKDNSHSYLPFDMERLIKLGFRREESSVDYKFIVELNQGTWFQCNFRKIYYYFFDDVNVKRMNITLEGQKFKVFIYTSGNMIFTTLSDGHKEPNKGVDDEK